MPVTSGALRTLKADRRRAVVNIKVRDRLKEAVAAMRKKPTPGSLVKVFRAVDRAVKGKVIHKNKAARIKSRLALLVKKK
ncbi:MAG: hypothetical protein UX91_C0001G0045 [Candidatus Amesbacteria bacterium GW2011_GWB1_47_19]|nr:MAG: hypothetical protein UW51_C0001G0045 [Candidatus Amesbacteria bacterium GW2011_GWA1_44_24]KKU32057.1 MAG: hypothetical protein UX46_C0001G0044 [Candidatus Amesbacteria bacterium GW2011_GWC1_46_24]KKU67741.1 MAG: hypothetical protein UX91_C0001G0045 [Candidatus Amesbacteria bacterium GW2011_GWB1_47_19]OGD06074.1 MAG: hypothetical protein A2379_03200 [Candidatus Amesbacteria bacterium RIFOXYB1_FULL_47_13]HBC72336.1 hypothetical protein [Candidatus Amesbacteria bacterium]